jgi:hypothetical protein
MWKWIGENEKQLKILFAIIAALYVVVEYGENVRQDRIANTMFYIHDYVDGKISETRAHLNAFMTGDTVKLEFDNLRGERNPWKRAELYNKRMVGLIKNAHLTGDIDRLLDYYQGIAVCVQTDRCDRGTACGYFFNDIQDFRENYRSILEDWASDLGESGTGDLTTLAQSECIEQFNRYCGKVPQSAYCKNRESWPRLVGQYF